MSEEGYRVTVEKDPDWGWTWTVRRGWKAADKYGYTALRSRHALRGWNFTHWGARRAGKRRLRKLRRYLGKRGQEVVDA